MNVCVFCKNKQINRNHVFYCNKCLKILSMKYEINVLDYLLYFNIMYKNNVPMVYYYSQLDLINMHDLFRRHLRVTNKSLKQISEIIIMFKNINEHTMMTYFFDNDK